MLSQLAIWEAQVNAAFTQLLNYYLNQKPEVIKALEGMKPNFREEYFFNNGVKAMMTSAREAIEAKNQEIRELKLKIQELEK